MLQRLDYYGGPRWDEPRRRRRPLRIGRLLANFAVLVAFEAAVCAVLFVAVCVMEWVIHLVPR